MSDADAFEIAQPLPGGETNFTSAMRSPSSLTESSHLVAAQRIAPLHHAIGVGNLAEVPRLPVVLEDQLLVQRVGGHVA